MNFENIKPSKSVSILSKAKKLIEQGVDVIPLSVGDTHFSPPQSIVNNINNAPTNYSHYTIPKGIEQLRHQIANKYNHTLENVTLTNGVKQGIFYVLQSLREDKVAILEPAWLGYQTTATICNKSTTSINTHSKNWIDQLHKSDFNILILCSPNNPDGKVFSKDEINNILSICKDKNAWVIFDNIYHVYDYSGKYKPFDYNKLIITGGFSKSHAVTGFRLGYIICNNQEINHKIDLLNQNIATCAPSISQYALLNLHKHEDSVYEFSKYYKENRDLVSNVIPEFEPYKPDGGFYYFIDVSKFGFTDGDKFCNEILDTHKIALVPGSAYGNFPHYIRMSFSVDRKTLMNGLESLKSFCKL